MVLVYKDRVKETTTTTGTGTLTLAGAVSGFRAFSDIGNGNTCKYCLLDANGTAWEVGLGTYTLSGTTLARTTVEQTSAGNTTPITLTSGTHTVFVDFSATSATASVRGHISGLTLSNNATATKLDVAAGKCRDSTDANDIILSSAITAGLIQTSGAWVAGSTQNKLDTGARTNSTWYAVHAIYKDNVADDWLFSLSATAPTLPANYTKFRRIGWAKTDGIGNIVAFTQYGDLFEWVTPVQDVDASNPGSLAVTRTLTLPSMAGIIAWVMAIYVSATAADSLYLSDLAATDSGPDRTTFFSLAHGVANNWTAGDFYVPTNGSAQIRSRTEVGTSATERVSTKGWLDRRGRDA